MGEVTALIVHPLDHSAWPVPSGGGQPLLPADGLDAGAGGGAEDPHPTLPDEGGPLHDAPLCAQEGQVQH